jgi:hypothetical protein
MNMIADTALQEHLAACELTYQLMMEENRLLKSTGQPPADDFLAQKRSALAQLDAALAMIRAVSASDLNGRQRATVVKAQQIVLKALLLDRENEQLLHKCTAPTRRAAEPKVRPTFDQIQKMYGKYSGRLE